MDRTTSGARARQAAWWKTLLGPSFKGLVHNPPSALDSSNDSDGERQNAHF